jgi:tetratricopeptide (TPR) repeat protein
MFVQLAMMRAETAVRSGDLDVAEDYARRALELGRELRAEHVALLWLPIVLLERGQTREAAELIESVELTDSVLGESPGVVLLAHRGRVRIALDDHEAGWRDLCESDRRMAAAGWQLSTLTDWLPSAAAALVQLGRRDEARALAQRELAEAVAFGSRRRWGIALSTAGLLEGGEQGIAWLREACETLERSGARLDHARALVHLGVGLRARGQREEARAPLSQALDLAHGCGTSVLAQQARTELIAPVARPRRDALTGVDALRPPNFGPRGWLPRD